MPISRLYHRIVSARWKAEFGVRMNVILDRYDHGLDYAGRVGKCLGHRAPDAVLIHVRPFPFLIRCKPIIRFADPSGRKSWVFHPRLFPLNGRAWNPAWEGPVIIGTASASLGSRQDPVKEIYPPYRTSPLRSSHIVLGRLAGLAAWARREELRAVKRAADICSASGVPLFILGPTPYPRMNAANEICVALSRMLRDEAASGAFQYIDPIGRKGADPRAFLLPDLWHLNEAGHAEMADSIFRALENARERFSAFLTFLS